MTSFISLSYRLAVAGLALVPLSGQGEPLLWGYSPSDPAPYVIIQTNELQHSLTREIGEAVAKATGRQVSFIAMPNKRIDESLASARISIICNTTPEWVSTPEQLLWTSSLYQDADVIITRQNSLPPQALQDLEGAIIGTTLGYHYSAAVTQAFNQQQMIRHDVRDLQTQLKMLERGRLDAVIGLRRAVQHQLSEAQTTFRISNWELEKHALRCAIAKPDAAESRRLAERIEQLIEQGQIRRLVEQFN